ncbi:MAG: CDP-alcohol phosphatidyltransferase family protein [candidate division Zixibacteria bacterium]|nr:CDP-alcohol phosphatidyltransferase family protein [candidate division Zixibacteria bacterium]
MRKSPDLEQSEKLPPQYRYVNISVFWIFYFRQVIKILYRCRVPHEAATALSILFGLISAYCFSIGHIILAAVAIHLKDVFDASDGALARLTGRGHLIGRYLDSLGDFFVLSATMIAIGSHAAPNGHTGYYLWAIVAIFSTFIQCSFFNFYQLGYVAAFGIDTLSSRQDENSRDDVQRQSYSLFGKVILKTLRLFYLIVYGWQDKLVLAVDNRLLSSGNIHEGRLRYGNHQLMIMQSALCFGTHIFVIILCALLSRPQLALIFISIVMNLYLIFVLYLRKRYYQRLSSKPAVFAVATAKQTGMEP